MSFAVEQVSYLHIGRPVQVIVCRADHVAISLHQAQLFLFSQVIQLLPFLSTAAGDAICSLFALSLNALDRDLVCFCAQLGQAFW